MCFALDRLGAPYVVSGDPDEIMSADKVIFPGVGEASTTMQFLQSQQLDRVIVSLKQPVLGICLGMQLLCAHSEENNTPCLGIFDAPVRRFTPDADCKVPHVGWNRLQAVRGWLPQELENDHVYYVHSYYVPVTAHTVAQSEYSGNFSAALQKENFFAVQFHPEKSGQAGAHILRKFLAFER